MAPANAMHAATASSTAISSSTPISTSILTSSTASAPIEQLPSNIPRLDTNGANWAIFSACFRVAMMATRRWGYFDGTKPRPTAKDPDAPTDDEREMLEHWDHEDLIARYLFFQRLPDSTMIYLSTLSNAKQCWARVNAEYTAKSVYAQNDLEQAFSEMRCPKDGDVRTFLMSVRYKREELAAAGVTITTNDYQRTVLCGIPEKLAQFASQVMTAVTRSKQRSIGCKAPTLVWCLRV
jgi:gag-polypeptide of LTR copia-type